MRGGGAAGRTFVIGEKSEVFYVGDELTVLVLPHGMFIFINSLLTTVFFFHFEQYQRNQVVLLFEELFILTLNPILTFEISFAFLGSNNDVRFAY